MHVEVGLSLGPGEIDSLLARADRAFQQGDFGVAIECADRILAIQPKHFLGLLVAGRSYLGQRTPNRAIEYLTTAARVGPDHAIVHHFHAQCLLQLDRYEEAEKAYLRAIRVGPKNAESTIELAQLYIRMERREEAVTWFRRAFVLEPDKSRGLIQLAKALIEEGKPEEAEKVLRRAISIDPKPSAPYGLLGQVLQQLGEFDKAADALEQAIANQPRSGHHYSHLVKCRKITETDRPLIDRMAALLLDTNLRPNERCYLHYASGKALDDLGEYQRAMGHFDEANKIMLQVARPPFDRDAHTRLLAREIQMPQYETHSLASSSEKPVFIVGMIRSGTTLVEQIVSSHPDVGAGGELRFWYDDIQTAACEGNVADPSDRNLADEYLDLLNRLAPGKKRVTDKMPLNFTVLGTIRSWLPNARIIHCRRHPLDTGVSMYVTPYPYPVNFLHSRENIVYYYEQYLLLMEHWRRHLPSDRFFEVDYENLVTNQERAAREIIAFLGIGWRDECLRPNENARTIRTPSMWQVRQPIYRSSIGRWRNYEPWLGELMKLMPQ